MRRVSTIIGLLLATQLYPAKAQAYDMDCAVILCLAGGFPPGCEAAYSYMISRITAKPPKPPFGFCAMGGPGDPTDADYPDNPLPGQKGNDSSEAVRATIDSIKDDDVRNTLESVRAEVSRGHGHCNQGDNEYLCTNMIELDGDGGNLFMGRRGSPYSDYWRRGKRVTFEDFQGIPRSIGDAEHYNKVGETCPSWGGDPCTPIYQWQTIAVPYSDLEPLDPITPE